MYKYILETAGDINWMALFALITFMTVFIMSILMIFRKDKSTLQHISNLPLSNEEEVA